MNFQRACQTPIKAVAYVFDRNCERPPHLLLSGNRYVAEAA